MNKRHERKICGEHVKGLQNWHLGWAGPAISIQVWYQILELQDLMMSKAQVGNMACTSAQVMLAPLCRLSNSQV